MEEWKKEVKNTTAVSDEISGVETISVSNGASIMGYWVKLLSLTPTSHMGAGFCPRSSTFYPALCYIQEKAAKDGASDWSLPHTHET